MKLFRILFFRILLFSLLLSFSFSCLLFLSSCRRETSIENKLENAIAHQSREDETKVEDDTFFSHLNKMNIPEHFRLKEIIVGNLAAPKTLIVYFSYTCPHCREFHRNEYPKFKKLYVDTGKIKVIFRNYIDDQGAYEAAQIIRCLCKDSVEKYEKLSNLVLSKQSDWLKSQDPPKFLIQIFTKNGTNENEARACLKRTDIGAGLMLEQQRAMRDLHLISMPSFIADGGKIHIGAVSCSELAQLCGLEKGK